MHDWHCRADYLALHRCGRPVFAWEWLRRVSAYREPRSGKAQTAAAFGLCRYVDPALPWQEARPIWLRDVDPFALIAEPTQLDSASDAFDLAVLARHAAICTEPEVEHWLISNGRASIRLDVAHPRERGPTNLVFSVAGRTRAAAMATSLHRLVDLVERDRFSPRLYPIERRAVRWALALRALDARNEGATRREIAEELFRMPPGDWSDPSGSFRCRVRRLLAAADRYARAHPSEWLSGCVR